MFRILVSPCWCAIVLVTGIHISNGLLLGLRHHATSNIPIQRIIHNERHGLAVGQIADACEDKVVGMYDRRRALNEVISVCTAIATTMTISTPVYARTPGSKDVNAAINQIQGAVRDLRTLETNWSKYTTIDAEGRAGSTDAGRRILGGIAPQAGSVAIEVAELTPLYRIDGAFSAIRSAALQEEEIWAEKLDLMEFDELGERILFAIQKADGDFYSVLFAAKGTRQIQGIFNESKVQVDQAICDFDAMLVLLKDAGAPGL